MIFISVIMTETGYTVVSLYEGYKTSIIILNNFELITPIKVRKKQ